MKFKGTKRLTLSKNKNQVLDDTKVLVIANVNDYGDFTHKHDALLFSKAPEMLEMLDKAAHKLYSVENPSTSCRILADEIMDLIKESTTL